MAGPIITHRKVSGRPQGTDPTRIYGNHWDDTHVITGLENVQNVDTTNASNITSGTLPSAQMPALTGGVTSPGGSTATTVVTNANLTGPITSVGNATSIASQTGTGTKLVVDTSPTIITPTITTSINAPLVVAPGALTLQTNGGIYAASIDSLQRFNLGTNVALPSGVAFGVNKNAAAMPAQSFPGETFMVRFSGVDGTAPIASIEAYGSFAALVLQRADGTGASPSAVQAGELIGVVTSHGYGATGFFGGSGQLRFEASQTWTNTAQGTRIKFETTPNGSAAGAATTEVLTLENDAGVTIPSTVTGGSKGANTLNILGPIYNNGTAPTGTGGYVRATSPALQTPNIGAATATSLTFSPTTNGIVGTTTNDNAGSGTVGEYAVASVAAGSAITLTTGVTSNLASISLTAGDWDVWCQALWTFGATSNVTFLDIGITTTSATLPTVDGISVMQWGSSAGTVLGSFNTAPVPGVRTRVSLSGTTTVFCVAQATFTVSTAKVWGSIQARRVR